MVRIAKTSPGAEVDPATRTIVVILNNTVSPKGDNAPCAKAIFTLLAAAPTQEP